MYLCIEIWTDERVVMKTKSFLNITTVYVEKVSIIVYNNLASFIVTTASLYLFRSKNS